ncbi:MAG TPA: energy transducer TonB [Acidobacteriaceae bacterium]
MFEGCLLESRGLAVSRTQRWSAVGSATFQLMLAALIIAVPLMRPQTLKIFTAAPHLTAPPRPVRPREIVRVNTADAPSGGPAAPSAPMQASSGIPHFSPRPGMPSSDDPMGPLTSILMDGGPAPMPTFGPGNAPAVTVMHATPTGPMSVSGGVSAGMLLSPIRPAYPQIAVLTKTQGTVVVDAVISKTGRIESAQVTSGPPMLRQAALDAVKEARYRPYLLSGEPVEVQTTVTVVFRLGE